MCESLPYRAIPLYSPFNNEIQIPIQFTYMPPLIPPHPNSHGPAFYGTGDNDSTAQSSIANARRSIRYRSVLHIHIHLECLQQMVCNLTKIKLMSDCGPMNCMMLAGWLLLRIFFTSVWCHSHPSVYVYVVFGDKPGSHTTSVKSLLQSRASSSLGKRPFGNHKFFFVAVVARPPLSSPRCVSNHNPTRSHIVCWPRFFFFYHQRRRRCFHHYCCCCVWSVYRNKLHAQSNSMSAKKPPLLIPIRPTAEKKTEKTTLK